MYLIIAVIFLMLCIEIYTIVKDVSLNFNYQEKKLEDSSKNFIEYTSDRSFEKIFDPGEIYTDDNYNLFIITDGLPLLMKKDQIYEIKEPFTLKYININEKIIRYYYK